jgi:hypothetical protein
MTQRPSLHTLVLCLPLLLLAACGEDTSKPYLTFKGGGFVFNYRIGEAFYGFVAHPERRLPEGAVLEASFEDPAGGPPMIVAHPAQAGQLQYVFESPPVKGVKPDRKYNVELKVLDPKTGKAYASYSKAFYTSVDQASLPDKPLVVGPVYTPNPEVDPKHMIPDAPKP